LASRIAAARGAGIISITLSAVDTHFWSVQVFTSISPFLSLTPQRCRFNPVRHCLSFHSVTTAFPLWQRHPHLPSSKKSSLITHRYLSCRSGLSCYLISCGLAFNLVVFFSAQATTQPTWISRLHHEKQSAICLTGQSPIQQATFGPTSSLH
jgi:hypothetical protein